MKIKNKRKKNKSGSHVGVVVSFVIFITFLFFLYSILEPVTSRERDKHYLLDYLKLNLVEKSTIDYTSVMITVKAITTKECINTNNVGEEQIPAEYRDRLIITNSSGNVLEYIKSGQGFKIKTGKNFIGVLKAYYSEQIENPPTTLTGCDPGSTEVGVIKTYQDIFESKLEELNESYYLDYEGMKAELGIPKGTEFSFYLLDGERNIIFSAEKSTPSETISVYIEEVPIQYMDSQRGLSFGFLRIKVW